MTAAGSWRPPTRHERPRSSAEDAPEAVTVHGNASTGNRQRSGRQVPDWRQEVAARSALRLVFYRPGRYAAQVRCPLLVLVCDQDQSALAAPAVRAANRAPRGELVRMPGGHYEPFLGGHERAVEAELSFLRRHLLGEPPASRPGASVESAGRPA